MAQVSTLVKTKHVLQTMTNTAIQGLLCSTYSGE